MSSPAPRLLITLCTYNERENLPLLVPEILSVVPSAELLVIDDNSPDGTGDLANKLAEGDACIHVLHRAGKQGLGSAILAGFRHAIEQQFDYVLNMDVDFSHHPRYLPALISMMDRCDVSIGSRYIAGGRAVGWSWKRHFMSRSINWYARCLLGLTTRDNSGAYRCYRVARIKQLDLGLVRGRGYAFQEEILYRCRRIGCRFEETPIVFEDRQRGESKINYREVILALWVIFRLGIDRLRGVSVSNSDSTLQQATH